MKKVFELITLFITLLSCNYNEKQIRYPPMKMPQETFEWFKAWQLVSDDLHLKDSITQNSITQIDFIFFDDSLIYTTILDSALNSTSIEGPSLKGINCKWRAHPHFKKIALPDGQSLEPSIFSFAAPNSGKPYFIMPLLAFWKQRGVQSNELGLSKLVTGIFVHEFSHSQQMLGLGKLANELEIKYNYNTEFTDNIIQDYFKDDSAYAKVYHKEVAHLYEAIIEKDTLHFLVKKDSAIRMMLQRQNRFLKNKGEYLIQLDKLFLTMEGLGQYLMYKWLSHPQGGNIDEATALKGIRRGGKNWSQEEGLGLFLCGDRMFQKKGWCKIFFTEKVNFITNFLINKTPHRFF